MTHVCLQLNVCKISGSKKSTITAQCVLNETKKDTAHSAQSAFITNKDPGQTDLAQQTDLNLATYADWWISFDLDFNLEVRSNLEWRSEKSFLS